MGTKSVQRRLSEIKDGEAFDLVVLGAGAGGFAAAMTAAKLNKKVLLVDNTPYVGGTTALSGGTAWMPLSHYLKDTPTQDSEEKVSKFLDLAVGNHSDRSLRTQFIRRSAEALSFLEQGTDLKFRACKFHPDYKADLEGATENGRALEPMPFITRHLGKDLALLRPPIPEFTVLGGMMVNREDIGYLLNRFKSFAGFKYTVSIVMRYAWDRVFHGQAARSVMGHALIARMLSSAQSLGVQIMVDTRCTELVETDGKVSALTLTQNGQSRTITTKGGVVLSGGGFGRSPKKRKQLLPANLPNWSPAAPGHDGSLHDLALSLGACYGSGEEQASFWAPVSIRQRADGSEAVFPHFVFDRSKPGTVCIDQSGLRFVNESRSYHEFGQEMLAQNIEKCWIITDARAINKYGLGIVRLGGDNLTPYLKDGYLVEGKTAEELAAKLGVNTDNLKGTLAQMNEAAASGIDEKFGRGTTVYQRANGDPEHSPNPTLGPINQAPYYAVRLYPADIGAAKGLKGDLNGQLVREDGSTIGGLYACGNDLHSVMGGTYPGPGITVGPAITFGYLAAKHACENL